MKRKDLPKWLVFLSSHALTSIAFIFLCIITVVGTIDQKYIGLFQSQKYYFESIYFFLPIISTKTFTLSIPLPGGFLILTVLFINLALAFIFKFQWKWRKIGLIISHIGLFLLLIGSFITFKFSQDGYLALFEGQQGSQFTSYHYYELVIKDLDYSSKHNKAVSYSAKHFKPGKIFSQSFLPFKIKIDKYYQNSLPMENNGAQQSQHFLLEQQFWLQQLKRDPENEKNAPGFVATFLDAKDRNLGQLNVILESPVEFNYKRRKYSIKLRKVRTNIPFTIKLIKFTRELYPGTNTPKHYESKVEVIEKGTKRPVLISMNQPLRYKGFTFFQASFASTEQGELQSTLAVVKNPAEQWPYFSCLLIFLGMFIYFLPKLFKFVGKTRGVNNEK